MTSQNNNEKPEKQRTITQNRALHLWFQLVAETLNEAGLDMRKALAQDIDIPWSKNTVKEYLWRPVQEVMLLKESTTKLTTKDIDKVFDVLNRQLGEKMGVHTPFPSIEELMYQEEFYKKNGFNQKNKSKLS